MQAMLEMGESDLVILMAKEAVLRQSQDGRLAMLGEETVDDPASFVETNLGQMLAYSIYRGIKGDWLEPRYKEFADRMRAAAHAKVDDLGLVQGVCGSPEFDHAGTATEGQVFYISWKWPTGS